MVGLVSWMGEPFSTTWRRRAMTIPTMLGVTAVATAALPIVAPAIVLLDLVRGRWRLPSLRVYLFALQYGINDSVEILAAPALWLAGGAGRRLDTPSSVARHERLQWWSATLLARRAEQLLGLRLAIDPTDDGDLDSRPVIVISRHVSVLDAALPGLVCHRAGLQVRGIIMAELLTDPGFDLLYRRLGSVFIPRDDGPEARAAIRAMARAAPRDTAFVIFPEGRLFTRSALPRSLARLREHDPERACRLAGLSNVLPPRPGGVLDLLAELPEADIVVIEHSGLDRLRTLGELRRLVPVDEPVRVTARRIPRRDLPRSRREQVEWLDELWLALDTRLEHSRRAQMSTKVDNG